MQLMLNVRNRTQQFHALIGPSIIKRYKNINYYHPTMLVEHNRKM